MKGNNKRILALILAASMMALCLCGCGSVAAAGNSAAASADASSESGSAASSAESSAEYESVPATGDKLEKDETVYVICNADGSVSKVIVSDWLKNGTKADQITDQTDLQDLEVVKGNATYTMDSDNMTIWDTKSGDVFYKGTSTKDLPVSVAVSYQLDGQDISAEDLAGKSGKVTIRFDYTNTQYEMVDVNGTQTKIYVPFVVLTGMVLDNEKFSDIAVSNGKLVSTGDDTMVIGFAMPGMQDSLNISKDDLEIPDYVELTADVTDFSLDTVMTLASAKFTSDVSDDDISSLETTAGVDNLDTLPDSLAQLTDAMKQLTDGSDELYTNMQTLLEKTNELATGVQELAAAVKQLDSGSTALYDGSISLRDNLKTLQTGLGKLSGSSASLNAGAKQVFQSLLDQANAQIKASGADIPTLTIENYDQVLSSASLASSVSAQANATAKSQVTAAVKAQESARSRNRRDAMPFSSKRDAKAVLTQLGTTVSARLPRRISTAAARRRLPRPTAAPGGARFDAVAAQQMSFRLIQTAINASSDCRAGTEAHRPEDEQLRGHLRGRLRRGAGPAGRVHAGGAQDAARQLQHVLPGTPDLHRGRGQRLRGQPEAHGGRRPAGQRLPDALRRHHQARHRGRHAQHPGFADAGRRLEADGRRHAALRRAAGAQRQGHKQA
jgi:X-X-X-Leu-X-X-Gly heptad repeat protein